MGRVAGEKRVSPLRSASVEMTVYLQIRKFGLRAFGWQAGVEGLISRVDSGLRNLFHGSVESFILWSDKSAERFSAPTGLRFSTLGISTEVSP